MAYFAKRYHPPGTPPGTLTSDAAEAETHYSINVIGGEKDSMMGRQLGNVQDCKPYLSNPDACWFHFQGAMDPESIRQLGALFDLHSLTLEDVLNVGQRPKMDVFDGYLFVIMSLPVRTAHGLMIEQISLFIGKNYVVSVCPGPEDPFGPIRQRLHNGGMRLRKHQSDYLLYSLLDMIIDLCYPVLEEFDERIEQLEDEVLNQPTRGSLQNIHIAKRELQLLRRMLWPQREILHALSRDEFAVIQEHTQIYFRDCYDHIIQILEIIETYRDTTSSLLDVYLSSVSNRLNETMRSLTLLATVFMPLTFIVGLYGMNFDRASPFNMPELGWRYGYFLVWLLMLVVGALMVVFFKRRKWW